MKKNEELMNINTELAKIFALLRLVHSSEIEKVKSSVLKNETKKKVYELCDGNTSVGQMVRKLDTTQPNVSWHLSSLLDMGIVSYEDRGNIRYYYKVV